MDRDFDGRLSFEEFMGEESPIEKLFKNMDKNGDGFVTKQVYKNSLNINPIGMGGYFARSFFIWLFLHEKRGLDVPNFMTFPL